MNYVSAEEVDGGSQFLSEFGKTYPVKAAFWLKAADDPFWYLYVASDKIDDRNFTAAYREVLRIANALHSAYFDPFRVKLGMPKEWEQAAIQFYTRFPLKIPTRIHGGFAGMAVDEVYLYPPPNPVAVP